MAEEIQGRNTEGLRGDGEIVPVYPQRWMTAPEWTRAISEELRVLAGAGSSPRERSLRRRATALRLCSHHIVGEVCTCGCPRPGSGKLSEPEGGQPCHARSCPRCGRKKSAKMSRWLDEIISTAPKNQRYRWRHIVLTAKYNPDNPDDLSPDELRRRARGLRQAWRGVWKEFGSHVSGAWVNLEIAGHGNVHLHALFYGRYVDHIDLQIEAFNSWEGAGFVSVSLIRGDDLASAVKEVAAYSVKSPGSANTDWIAGLSTDEGRARMINPKLAARWEVAMFGQRLGDRYGFFRNVPEPNYNWDTDRPEAEVACPNCGTIPDYRLKLSTTLTWVLLCKLYKVDAMGDPVHLGTPNDLNEREILKEQVNERWKKTTKKITQKRLSSPRSQQKLRI